jgi:5,10-methylenetetrahydrofolate reductase
VTDRLLARLARGEWTVTVEVVTPSPNDHAARARIMTLADAVRDENRIAALTLTDRTTALDADPIAFAPHLREHARSTPLVHLAGKARDARGLEDALARCAGLGIASVLLTGGDAVPHVPGGLDALEMLALARARVPDIVPLAVLALPRAVRGAVSWERALAKRAAGAEAFIAQVSWDLYEREILAEWQTRLTAPIIGAVMPLTRGRLDFLAAHHITGIEVPRPLRERVSAEGGDAARCRLALDLVLLRRLGYVGAHVSGVLMPALLREALDEAERLDTTLGADWRDVWREAVGIA